MLDTRVFRLGPRVCPGKPGKRPWKAGEGLRKRGCAMSGASLENLTDAAGEGGGVFSAQVLSPAVHRRAGEGGAFGGLGRGPQGTVLCRVAMVGP